MHKYFVLCSVLANVSTETVSVPFGSAYYVVTTMYIVHSFLPP